MGWKRKVFVIIRKNLVLGNKIDIKNQYLGEKWETGLG
jgi:hypothetical protein